MNRITRRTLVQGGTALGGTGVLTGPALLNWAKAWAQNAPWKPEKGAKLSMLRWKYFVQSEDDAFVKLIAAFTKATGVPVEISRESYEDVQPKASVAANTGTGPDLFWGLYSLPHLFPQKCMDVTDVADYLGKKYGGWVDSAIKYGKSGNKWICIPVCYSGALMNYRIEASKKAGFSKFPDKTDAFLEYAKALEYAKQLYAEEIPGTAAWNDASNNKAFLGGEIYWTNNGISIYVAAKKDPTKKQIAEDMDHAYWPVGPIGHPTELHLMYPVLAMTYTKYPQACKALMAFMLEADNFNPWIESAQGYLTHCLNAYDKNPVWTADPKTTPFRDVAKRTLTAGGLGSVGEKAATAIADFVILDMFANYCTGREDVKGAIAVAERQLKRIYR